MKQKDFNTFDISYLISEIVLFSQKIKQNTYTFILIMATVILPK